MMMQNLIQNIVDQADYYLKQAKEFYPFASIINKDAEIRPLGILLNHEKPDPGDVLLELEKVANKGLASGEYIAVAIGVNVNLKNGEKQNINFEHNPAVEIRFKDSFKKVFKIMALPYSLNPQTGEIVFEEFLSVRQD